MAIYTYVSLQGEDRISIFAMDAATGELEHRGDTALASMPAPLVIDPQKRYLFAGRRKADDYGLSSFRIDRVTGGLTLIGEVPLQGDPVHISIDQKGDYLLSAYYYQERQQSTPSRSTGHLATHQSNGRRPG